ncbi:MAG: hypothetical protein NSGCLCUN01_04031 [uncultured Clostridium sp.]
MKRLNNKESFTCKKLKSLMEAKKFKSEDIVKIIDEKSSDKVKRICPLTISRMNEIIQGSCPTVLECILIAQALEKGIGYFYYNGYQVY